LGEDKVATEVLAKLKALVEEYRDDAEDEASESGDRSSYTSVNNLLCLALAAYWLGRNTTF
jgi:hypothetical protein